MLNPYTTIACIGKEKNGFKQILFSQAIAFHKKIENSMNLITNSVTKTQEILLRVLYYYSGSSAANTLSPSDYIRTVRREGEWYMDVLRHLK